MTNIRNKNTIKNIFKILLILAVFCLFISFIINIGNFYNIYKLSNKIQGNISVITEKINKKEFSEDLLSNIKELNTDSVKLEKNIKKIIIINEFPFINKNIKSLEELSRISILGSDSFIKFYPVIEKNYNIIAENKNINIVKISDEQKDNLVSGIYKIKNDIPVIQSNISDIIKIIEQHKNKNLLPPLKKVWLTIEDKKEYINGINTILPILENIPELFGIPKTSKYLFLLQNNTEIRPTGGFIGTYGIINMADGKISKLFTDNVYNLDRPAENRLKIKAPKPLVEAFDNNYLYFRDANWNPDYEESAKYLASLYQKESLNYYPITGVIAITPSVIQDIIGYFGEITVMNVTLNKDNAIDLLNYETKFGYWENRGISESQRKIIIQKLADVILEKISKLSLSELKDLSKIAINNLDNKQILLYFNNTTVQNMAISNNWAGKMQSNKNSDYLAVIDANLGSGKFDKYLDRSIDYDLRYINKELTSSIVLTYKNKYNEYVKNSIYQDDLSFVQYYKGYTRIYVPIGSKLEYFKINEDIATNIIDTGKENGKTFFGFNLNIPKNETYTYKIQYILPEDLIKNFEKEYYLIHQKQAGIEYNNININISLNKPIENYFISSQDKLSVNSYNNKFNINGKNYNDKTISINFYSNSDISNLQKNIKKDYLSFKKEEFLNN